MLIIKEKETVLHMKVGKSAMKHLESYKQKSEIREPDSLRSTGHEDRR